MSPTQGAGIPPVSAPRACILPPSRRRMAIAALRLEGVPERVNEEGLKR